MGRWERLADTLTEADIPAKADRVGESRQILIRINGALVIVHDTWWRKNLDVWTGWEVYIEGPDSITLRTYPKTKKRGEVRQNVADALAELQAAAERQSH